MVPRGAESLATHRVVARLGQETGLDGPNSGLGAVADVELAEDMLDVSLDGAHAEVQLLRDLRRTRRSPRPTRQRPRRRLT